GGARLPERPLAADGLLRGRRLVLRTPRVQPRPAGLGLAGEARLRPPLRGRGRRLRARALGLAGPRPRPAHAAEPRVRGPVHRAHRRRLVRDRPHAGVARPVPGRAAPAVTRFAVQLHGTFPMRMYPELARAVERHPFAELTVHDVLWWRPVW